MKSATVTMTERTAHNFTLPDFVADLATRLPHATAIVYGGRTTTFGEIDDESRRVARGLTDIGVASGDRVALWLPNVPAWLTLFLACARLGAIAVSVNTRFRSSEVADIVGRSGAKVLALWPGFRAIDFIGILDDVDSAALDRVESIILYDDELPAGQEPRRVLGRRTIRYPDLVTCPRHEASHAGPETGCAIFTTSGTTRAPKFVLHSQAAIVNHGRDIARDFGFDAPDGVMLQALPLCGVFGLNQAMASLAAGRPMIVMPAFDAADAARLVHDHRVTHFNATDDMIHRMLDERTEPQPFPTLRMCGFANFNPGIADLPAAAERCGLRLIGLYGMSEMQALFARQKVEADLADRT